MISSLKLGTYELRRFKGTLPRIAIAFLAIVPLMYGLLYLWSNWDPYGKMDKVPAAVVNLDQPAQALGKTVTAGDQLVSELQSDPVLDWHFTDAEDAAAGLAEGRYFMTLTVPQDFSANLVSPAGDNPQRAMVQMRENDANGFVISRLLETAQSEIEQQIDAAAVETYFEAVFTNLGTLKSEITEAATGAGEISSGLATAKTGATDLSTGLTTAKSGSAELVTSLDTAKQGSAQLVTGASDAKTGADSLSTGLTTAKTGADDLNTGIGELSTGATTLASGADQVAAGTQQLVDTVVPVLDKVVPILPRITQAGADLSTDVADLTSTVTGGQESLDTKVQSAKTSLDQFLAANPDLATDPAIVAVQTAVADLATVSGDLTTIATDISTGAAQVSSVATVINDNSEGLDLQVQDASTKLTELNTGAGQVATGAHTLDDGLATAKTGAQTLADGLATAETGASDLATGLGTLSTGVTDLDTGLGQIADGAGTLDTGLGTADTGASTLLDGLTQLDTGATQLSDELSAGAKRIPSIAGEQQDEAVHVLSQPSQVELTTDNPATYYGRGMAPFFFAIAIWVFGISVFLIMRPITGRALAGRASAARLALAGWLPIGGLAVFGSLILFFAVWGLLGLDPVNPAASLGVVVLAAVAFSAIAHLLRNAFGTVGSAITLVLLMLQLTSCGGLYPPQTMPEFFRILNPVVPMTYLVDALRITFTGGLTSHLIRDVLVLIGFTVAAAGLSVFVTARRKRFAMKDLHPALAA